MAATLPRETIWLAQTPQGFRARRARRRRSRLVSAAWTPRTRPCWPSRRGTTVAIVQGDDAEREDHDGRGPGGGARACDVRRLTRVGTGYDLHRLVEGRPLVLAGVVLPFDRGPARTLGRRRRLSRAGRRDASARAGAGDIGRHFPNTDPRWKDAPGLDLLARAVAIVRELGWRVANVDVTVLLERPKTRAASSMNCAGDSRRVLGVDAGAVSVKGKTNEGVDAVGRGEAIAAHAAVLLAPSRESGDEGALSPESDRTACTSATPARRCSTGCSREGRRHVRPSHRRHRRRAVDARVGAQHPRGPALARPRLG